MPKETIDPADVAAGRRLRQTRKALGFETIRRFAQIMDEPETNVTKWENGVAAVPRRFIRKMNERYGVTYEWIFDGVKRQLPHDLVLKLEEPAD